MSVMQGMLKFFIYALIGYLALCSIVLIFQRKMLYFPSQMRFSEESASWEGLRHWPSHENFRGFINRDEMTHARGTVIVFHGNAGTAFHRGFYNRALARQNLRVVLAEYPGYGGRVGKPSENVLVEDALETIELAYQEYGEPLYLWGESLGCGVVSSSIPQTEIPIAGVVLFLPWDTLADLARTHYWYLPTRLLLLDRYNNVENLRGYQGRIAVLLAGKDEVVPVKHGKTLYESLRTDKHLWVFDNARHNQVPVGPELSWWSEVVQYLTNTGDT
jgi:alpha-beta hydrolase superfamily lysophospholipase